MVESLMKQCTTEIKEMQDSAAVYNTQSSVTLTCGLSALDEKNKTLGHCKQMQNQALTYIYIGKVITFKWFAGRHAESEHQQTLRVDTTYLEDLLNPHDL